MNFFKDNVYWLTDKRSIPILKWFMPARRVLAFGGNFARYTFSKNSRIYNADNYIFDESLLRGKLRGKWHGYVWDDKADVCPGNEFIALTQPYADFVDNDVSWEEALVRGMGFKWERQDYPLIRPRCKESADFGLNWRVHVEWESKQWPLAKWKQLDRILSASNSVSWQEGEDNLESYLKWISSCKVIVTSDTFGLHLASALRKKVVVIAGPTQGREFSYGRVFFMEPPSRFCMPCNRPKCARKAHCLDDISAESVSREALRVFN